MSKYTQRLDNEGWEEKSGVTFKLACCDCGLVHRVVVVAGRKGSPVGIAASRDNRATAARRRKMKFTISKADAKRQEEMAKGCARLMLEDDFDITPKKKP